jgi:hypothetical protein
MLASFAGVQIFKPMWSGGGFVGMRKRVAVSDGTAVGASLVGYLLSFFKRMGIWFFI